MAREKQKIGHFCTVMTGMPISRARKLSGGESAVELKVLTSRALEGGMVADEEVIHETVFKVKENLLTKEGDVIVKASTPYDCVYIDKEHEGMLVTSFALILRAMDKALVNMKYVAMYLNQSQTREELQNLSKGVTLQLIKQRDMAALEIPVIPKCQQDELAALFENTQSRKQQCLRLMAKSDELLEAEFSRIVFDGDI